MSVTTDSIVKTIKAQSPGLTDLVVRLALMNAVSRLCRDVLQAAPPSDPKSDFDGWLSEPHWVEYATLLMSGALWHVFSSPKKPYTNLDLAKAHLELFTAGLARAREVAAAKASVAGGYERLMANLRTAAPGLRDPALQQEVFNTVEQVARFVLQITPPAHNAAPTSWLPAEQWDRQYLLLYAGTMVRLLTQPGKPWTDPQLASVYQAQYSDLATLARSDDPSSTQTGAVAIDSVLDVIRSTVPGSVDPIVKQTLKRVIIEFCHRSRAWRETRQITPVIGQVVYPVAFPGLEIVEVLSITHLTLPMYGAAFDFSEVVIPTVPTLRDTLTPLVLSLIFAPAATNDDYTDWLPDELAARYATALIDGVLAYMFSMPGKPYTNGAAAAIHGQKFRNAMNLAGIDARRERVKAPQGCDWRFPRFA